MFSERFACPVCGLSLPELEPRQFSFNSPFGACPDCHGVGTRREVNAELILGDPSISILEGVILPWGEPSGYLRKVVLPTLAKAFKFDLQAPWSAHPESARSALLHGAPGRFRFQTDGARGRGEYESEWEGILKNVERRYRESTSDAVRATLEEFMVEQPCQTCGGKRLKPESLAVLVNGRSIGDVVDLPVERALEFFEAVPLRSNGRPRSRPGHGRADPQGGERPAPLPARRGARLSHARPCARPRSREARPSASGSRPRSDRGWWACSTSSTSPASGCTSATTSASSARCAGCATWATRCIVVEHDAETIAASDHVIDLGPRAGRFGGEVVAEGPVEAIREHPDLPHRALPPLGAQGAGAGRAAAGGARSPAPGGRRARQQPAEPHGGHPARPLRGRDRRLRLGQVHPGDRHPVSGAGAALLPGQGHPRRAHADRGARPDRQGHRHRPEPHRPHAALQPGDLHRAVHPDPGAVHPAARRQAARLRPGPVLVQREGRPLRGLPGRRAGEDRDALPSRRLRALRGVQGPALQPGDARGPLQGPEHRRRAGPHRRRRARLLRATSGASPRSSSC